VVAPTTLPAAPGSRLFGIPAGHAVWRRRPRSGRWGCPCVARVVSGPPCGSGHRKFRWPHRGRPV